MRKLINSGFRQYFKWRMRRIERFMKNPHAVQERVFQNLIQASKNTEWGRQFNYRTIRDEVTFAERVPVQDYDSLKPYINRMMLGEKDVLWNGTVRWFSKSSGTTSDKSKYIPVSYQNLHHCHIRGSWDTMTLLYQQRPDARQFECKSLVMGGSLETFAANPKVRRGDVSAIMTYNMPRIARPFFTPDLETALMDDFEEKIERMARITSQEKDLVMIGGVPTWTVVLFRRILELTGKRHMLEVWPNLQGYIHGGVSFTPYREQFRHFIPSDTFSYQETYNASEGYFAVQNDLRDDGMLLLLDNGVYYEFVPMEEWNLPNPKAIPLSEVELGKNYSMLISTNAGLWRYQVGDTVTFVEKFPYRIKITGRTKAFINAFGEEVMVENADEAIARACRRQYAEVAEYTVAPVYFGHNSKGGHQWLIEFNRPPRDLEAFAEVLDRELQQINSDYEAKRFRNMALNRLQIQSLPSGTFHRWLKSKGKFGGQHKVPRLSNHRTYVDELLAFMKEMV